MKTNSTKTIIYSIIAAVVIIIVGIALMNTDKATEAKKEAAATTNSLIGKPFPDIQLTDKEGKAYDLTALRGKNVVLFFNEGIMCYPACWNQMAAFGTDTRFNSNSLVALSVVTDSPAQWQTATEKMPELAKATILFDQSTGTSVSSHHGGANPTGTASYRLGILSMASSMHPGQSPGHTYILLDKQGVVREVYDDANMAVNNDVLIEKINKF